MLSEAIGKHMMAIEYADKLLRVNSKCFEAYFIKGTCLGKRKKYGQAIKALEKALKIQENIETFHNLGYIYLIKGERNIAIDYFNKCLEIDKDNLGAHLNIAIAYFDGFSNEIALYHINEAIRIDSKCYKALSVKGEILRYLGELDDAIKCFIECMKYDNKNDQALFGAGLSLIENNNFKEGVIYLSKWLKNNKNRLFKVSNDKALIIDIGWERTSMLLFELVNSNTVNLVLNKNEKIPLRLPSNKDYIFIGCIPILDSKDEILFPILGKVFENDNDYKKTIQEINKRVELVNFFDSRRFITFSNDISVYIEEKETSVYIELQFKDYRISGLTDTKSSGYYEFIKKYEEYKDIQINICNEEKKEEIILSGIRNVKIKKMNYV
jgi:tetratricopeptide (TPR) repeat protein